jgi:ParB family transcriptional regulator, chromosome partitioning protein
MKTSFVPIMKTSFVPLEQIHIGKRLRQLKPDFVARLAESIELIGLLKPITVRPRRAGGYHLVCGWHRIEAMRKLGRPTIEAIIRDDLNALRAKLLEIDENLTPEPLSPAERMLHEIGREELIKEIKKR